MALSIALFAAGCTSDSSERESDASTVGSSRDGSASDGAVDADLACQDIVATPQGQLARPCIYSFPPGATLDWSSESYSAVRVESADGGLLAFYDGCECQPSLAIELIPQGADPRTWQLPDASISATDYDRGCQADTDCVAVIEGDLKFPCYCPSAAISRSVAATYQADLVHKRQGGVFASFCGCPEFGVPVCHEGQCIMSVSLLLDQDAGVGPDAGDAATRDAAADGSTL